MKFIYIEGNGKIRADPQKLQLNLLTSKKKQRWKNLISFNYGPRKSRCTNFSSKADAFIVFLPLLGVNPQLQSSSWSCCYGVRREHWEEIYRKTPKNSKRTDQLR